MHPFLLLILLAFDRTYPLRAPYHLNIWGKKAPRIFRACDKQSSFPLHIKLISFGEKEAFQNYSLEKEKWWIIWFLSSSIWYYDFPGHPALHPADWTKYCCGSASSWRSPWFLHNALGDTGPDLFVAKSLFSVTTDLLQKDMYSIVTCYNYIQLPQVL